MRLGWLTLFVCAAVNAQGCISKGDTEVVTGEEEVEGKGSLCKQYCAKIKEQCGEKEDCEAECKDWGKACPTESTSYLECAIPRAFACDPSGEASVPICDGALNDLRACLDPVGPYGLDRCERESDCTDDTHCLPTAEPVLQGDSVCTPECEEDAHCASGCCGQLDTGVAVCGLPADCAPVAAGDPCLSSDDCASGLCAWGGCTEPCETNADCGVNILGLQNHCIPIDEELDPVCLPGCETDDDCQFYYSNAYYDYNPQLTPFELACLEGEGGSYCF